MSMTTADLLNAAADDLRRQGKNDEAQCLAKQAHGLAQKGRDEDELAAKEPRLSDEALRALHACALVSGERGIAREATAIMRLRGLL